MIKINDVLIEPSTFGDGTLKCEAPDVQTKDINKEIVITWCYDSDAELFCVYSLTRHLQDIGATKISLKLPYIPHARQDRYVSNRLFTLKYFADIINSLGYYKVYVLDPHSKVSLKLINNIEEMPLPFMVSPGSEMSKFAVMFPDKGAAEKYKDRYQTDTPIIIGKKHRNSEGRIDSYELENFTDGITHVLIRDDICSYGGTFVAAAKELRKRGVCNIILVVSHCENNILKGEVFDHITTVFTTDSICTVSHPKLVVSKIFR